MPQLVLLVVSIGVAACSGAPDRQPEYELTGQAMGTTYSIKVVSPPSAIDLDELGRALDARLRAIDARMSTYKPDSELSRFNASTGAGWFNVSRELCDLVARALAISRHTSGAFDVTVGPLVNLWGFGPAGDLDSLPADDAIDAARASVGYERLHADCDRPALRKGNPALSVDLSAIAKGFAVDEAAEMLAATGASDFLVEIGGELRMRGHNASGEPWAIAVEKPEAAVRAVESVIHLTDTAMATSGDYRNFYEFDGQRYSHTIDPRTGRPVTHDGAAVTVLSASAADADALATALLVMGPGPGLRFAASEDLSAYFLSRTADGIAAQATGRFSSLVN